MKKFFLLGIALSSVCLAKSQTIATVGNQNIDAKEFMWVYNKNNQTPHRASLTDLSKYLDLYINYRLKLLDAKQLGFDLDTAYQAEIAGYEKALKAQPKYNPTAATYQYLLNEYRDGILMFNLSEQKVWNKAQENEAQLIAFYDQHKANYENKAYTDVRGLVINDLQKKLEQDWVQELHKKYKVKINRAELAKIAKQ